VLQIWLSLFVPAMSDKDKQFFLIQLASTFSSCLKHRQNKLEFLSFASLSSLLSYNNLTYRTIYLVENKIKCCEYSQAYLFLPSVTKKVLPIQLASFSYLSHGSNKLECLYLASLSNFKITVTYWAIFPVEKIIKCCEYGRAYLSVPEWQR
jgi:hypothetical protein